jgi:hypothetical protein
MSSTNKPQRREFLQQTVAAATIWKLLPDSLQADEQSGQSGQPLRLATFHFDVTPPLGHSLCGGWIKPVEGVTDNLQAMGFVLLGAGKPIVIVAVDWTGILNEAHVQWRTALANAAGTTPDRVAVQCVHQHNAPFACLGAEKIVMAEGDLPHIVEVDYFNDCLKRGAAAVRDSLGTAQAVTHVGQGEAKVDRVASNRRIYRDTYGIIKAMRGSSCKDPKLRAMAEGIIDPMLKTVAFYNDDKRIAACHYYATHPMSYYGDGLVSSDFVGIARKQHQAEEPHCQHIYFTGAGGNISAGKYNDGSHPVRKVLAKRIYDGIAAAGKNIKKKPLTDVTWRTVGMLPTARDLLIADELQARISNKSNSTVNRNRPSYMLSWLQRLEQKTPILLSALSLGDISLLHLPAESFIEYQLRAQTLAPNRFVATAAYGDGGPWYIPIAQEYANGGYEVSVAFSDSSIDATMTAGIAKLLG